MKKILLLVTLGLMSTQASARNAYDDFSDQIDKAKWQLGNPSRDVCDEDECDDYMDDNQDLIYSSGGDLWFSSDGNESRLWRSELRYLDSFRRNHTRSMSARVNTLSSSSSDGYTIMQLHKEDADGPPIRLAYIDGDSMAVSFRRDERCDSDDDDSCVTHTQIANSASGAKDVLLSLAGRTLTVSVGNTSQSYRLNASNSNGIPSGTWNNSSTKKYYWKAGIYFQDAGSAVVEFDNFNW